VQHALCGIREIKPLSRARDGDIHQPPLFLDARKILQRIFVREKTFFKAA
jgi:hypothetical protein